ncbi:hypothetical protein ES703_101783 [subsurface metagenome]
MVYHLFHPLASEGNGGFPQLALGQVKNPFGEYVPDNPFQLTLEPAVVDRPAFRRFPGEETVPVGGVQVQRKSEGEIAAQVYHLGAVAFHGLLNLSVALVVAIAVSPLEALVQLVFGALNASHSGEQVHYAVKLGSGDLRIATEQIWHGQTGGFTLPLQRLSVFQYGKIKRRDDGVPGDLVQVVAIFKLITDGKQPGDNRDTAYKDQHPVEAIGSQPGYGRK